VRCREEKRDGRREGGEGEEGGREERRGGDRFRFLGSRDLANIEEI